MFAVGLTLLALVFVISFFSEDADEEDEITSDEILLTLVGITGFTLVTLSLIKMSWEYLP